MVNKAAMIERIAELVREGRIDGISDIRDESDRRGMRVVIELKKEAPDEVILNQLYRLTPMQTTFGINLLALVNNRPRTLGLHLLVRALKQDRACDPDEYLPQMSELHGLWRQCVLLCLFL